VTALIVSGTVAREFISREENDDKFVAVLEALRDDPHAVQEQVRAAGVSMPTWMRSAPHFSTVTATDPTRSNSQQWPRDVGRAPR
jgi:hypothetical protein